MKISLLLISLFISFLFHSRDVQGQICTNPGGGAFELVEPQGCVGKPVLVRDLTVAVKDIEYVYDFDKNATDIPDKSVRTYSTSFTYAQPGTYTILQWGQGGFTACEDVRVYETAAPNAEFTACKNGKVRLTILDDAIYQAYDAVEIRWSDGTSERVEKGSPLVRDKNLGTDPSATIKGLYDAGYCSTEVKSKVMSGLINPPSLSAIKITRIEMGSDGVARVTYEGMEDIETELFVSTEGGSFVSANNQPTAVEGTLSINVEGLDPLKVYRFKLVSKDICGNLINSLEASSVVLKKDLVVSDESNSMTWDAYNSTGSMLVYQILRNNGGTSDPVFTSASGLFFSDDQVKCGEAYTYTLLVSDGDVRSYSAPLSLVPTTAQPEMISTASLMVNDEHAISTQVSLSGNGITSTYNLIVERAELGSSDFQTISPANNQSITFDDANVITSEKSYCYRFTYENSCKLTSPPSHPICSILLTNNIQDISWTDSSPFSGAVESYDLLYTDADGNGAGEMPKQLETRHDIDLDTDGSRRFQVRAKSGGMVSFSNKISLQGDVIMLVPDIFTPNGDTHNDQFVVKSHFTDTFRMRIYTRWGEMVFQSENTSEGWDGNFKGQPAAGGYYIYKIDATTSNDTRISKTGSLVLVR